MARSFAFISDESTTLFPERTNKQKQKHSAEFTTPPTHISPGRDPPGVDESQGLERLGQPEVGQHLHLPPQLEPLLPLRAAQQTCEEEDDEDGGGGDDDEDDDEDDDDDDGMMRIRRNEEDKEEESDEDIEEEEETSRDRARFDV